MQILKIKGKLPGYNQHNEKARRSYGWRNEEKKQAETLIHWSAKAQKLHHEAGPCFFVFEWHEISKGTSRDPDNIAFAKKFIFDRLQHAGILDDDKPKNVRGFSDRFYYDGRQGVTVYIIPEEEAGEMEASAWKI